MGLYSVHTLGKDINASHHCPASWDESSFSNVYKSNQPNTVFEKEKQEVKPSSLEASFERLKQQEHEWKLKAEHSKEEANEKAEIVEALKKKIAELVVKLQEERREKLQEQERYKLIKSDFEELGRNLEWHKKQLHECQVARDRAQKDLDEEKQRSPKSSGKLLTDDNHKESQISLPVKEYNHFSSPMKLTTDDLSTKSVVQDRLEDSQRWAKEEKAYWEAMVSELEGQVKSWKQEVEVLSDAMMKGERERATWLGRIAELQKQLEERSTDLEGFKGKLKESEYRFAEEEEKRRIAEGEREELRAALKGALKEKTTLDGAIECIRDDFERVRKSFELMKSILAQREKELADMKVAFSKNQAEVLDSEQMVVVGGRAKELKVLDIDLKKGAVSQDSSANLVKPTVSLSTQTTMDSNNDEVERGVEDVSEPSKMSESSMLGASSCCLASMERVDLEWRQKHRASVRALIKKMSQKQKRLTESENLQGNILDPIKGSKLPLSKTIPQFSLLPVPSKFNDSVIMQLISKGQEAIEGNNDCSVAKLKSSLISLEEEVSNLENKIRLTFLSEQKQREIKTAD